MSYNYAAMCPYYRNHSITCQAENAQDECLLSIIVENFEREEKEETTVEKKKEEEKKTIMKKENKVQMHMHICTELNKLYERKNHDYGDSFHQTFLEEGMAMARIRLGDKFSRFKTLSKGVDQKVSDESIRDTLIDLANYAIMTVMEMDLQKEESDNEDNWK